MAKGRGVHLKGYNLMHKKGCRKHPFKYGGADGTRTRDPRRDRPVF